MNNNIKSKMRDNILVQMYQYVDQETLQILENILVEEFETVNMERRETLPAEVVSSIDKENKYIIQLYLYKNANLADGTVQGYLRSIRNLLLYTQKSLTQISDIDILAYLNYYEKKNLAETGRLNNSVTVNNERKFISAFFGWMRRERLIECNPVETIPQRPETRKPIDFFTQMELEQLRDNCKDIRERAIIEVLRSTGARVGEILMLNRFTINWETGDVIVKSEKKRNGNSYRILYLDETARYYLKKYFENRTDNNPALFLALKSPYKPLKKAGIEVIMRKIGERAGLACRVYPHKMRKTLGMTLREKGVDIGTIQEVLGHEDPAVTVKYYAASKPEELRNIRKRAA